MTVTYLWLLTLLAPPVHPAAEPLDRAMVAVPAQTGLHVSWRQLPSDAPGAGFNLYRINAEGRATKANAHPVAATTDFVDEVEGAKEYRLRPVTGETEGPECARCVPLEQPYQSLKLEGNDGVQKLGLGDLDGDGRLDYVLKRPDTNVDPYYKYWEKSTGTYYLDAVTGDGRRLWRYDMGWSIERGIWYSPFLVYDLDRDGRAEVMVKAGEGDPREPDGKVRKGAEWLVVLDGRTGRERCRAPWPTREGFGDGEDGYNLASRNQLAVAWLDGQNPSVLALRGTYSIMKAEAFDLVDGKLRAGWKYLGDKAEQMGQGAHFTHAADLDADGRDEVVLGSMVLDDNGAPLWCTRLGHPDHMYLGDLDPRRPGLEIYYGIESARKTNGMCQVDAATGKILWGWDQPTTHVHATGLCSDIDPEQPGAEAYSADSVDHNPTGAHWLWGSDGSILRRDLDWSFGNNAVYWDADLQREVISRSQIIDYGGASPWADISGGVVLIADLMGDWREEVVCSRPGELRIYTTPERAFDRRATLLSDPLYRADVAMTAMGYTQVPSHLANFEAQSPNLNLRAGLDGDPRALVAVVSAPLGRGIDGRLTISAADDAMAPARFEVKLAAGERKVFRARLDKVAEARVTALVTDDDLSLPMTATSPGSLPNGGFERSVGQSPTGWAWWSRDNSGGAKTLEPGHNSRRCAALSFDGKEDWAFTNGLRLAVKPGQKVTARGWARSDACDSLDLAVVGYAGTKLVNWNLGVASGRGAFAWREFVATATVPEGVDTAVIRWVGRGKTRVCVDEVGFE
ncbi:MAG: hypothetical protein HZB16_05395 [Armatimonadetes bacterium]|nr:hypothetical protein [Armatimonadota bacterium]